MNVISFPLVYRSWGTRLVHLTFFSFSHKNELFLWGKKKKKKVNEITGESHENKLIMWVTNHTGKQMNLEKLQLAGFNVSL